MARVPRLLVVSVPRSARIPAYPGYPEFEPFNTPGVSAHRALRSPGANNLAAESGTYVMHCLPLRVAG
jgi:hypothetical protein